MDVIEERKKERKDKMKKLLLIQEERNNDKLIDTDGEEEDDNPELIYSETKSGHLNVRLMTDARSSSSSSNRGSDSKPSK